MHEPNDNSDAESDSFLGNPDKSLRRPGQSHRFLPWLCALSFILNVLLSTILLIELTIFKRIVTPSYESGFESDLDSVKPEIELVRYKFMGGVELDRDGNFFADHTGHQYIGKPAPEIDRAWNQLLNGLNIDVESSAGMSGRTFRWPESGLYFTGLENRLRQALYPEYYDIFNNPDDPDREDHIGHCINHLRQAIQCHADLTPMEWKVVDRKIILDTSTDHTCRNFERIHEWAKQRRTKFENIEEVRNGSLFIVD